MAPVNAGSLVGTGMFRHEVVQALGDHRDLQLQSRTALGVRKVLVHYGR
ncbi:MAG: hypothetical protein M3355_05000 [Actinomycetota bacterium]|nr:hypothetical protein [Actinomycetota bacterium]